MKKIITFILCLSVFLSTIILSVPVSAATIWQTIPSDKYIYDSLTYNGVTTNAYFPKSSTMYSGKYDSDSTYSCAALPVRFFQNYGISIRIPGSGSPSVLDGSGTFIQVTTPQIGDVLRKPGVHWAIVKAVNGNSITVFEQNYWWNDNGTWKAGKNRTISQSEINNGTWVLYRCTSFNSSTTPTTPSTSVSITTLSNKCSTTNDNAILYYNINKPSDWKVTEIGIKIRKDGSTYANGFEHKQASNYNHTGKSDVEVSWDFKNELNHPLTHATKYYLKYYAKVNGEEYWSTEYYFTTTGSHSFGSWSTTNAATCTSGGTKKRSCACGLTETSNISATGHNWASSFTVDKEANCKSEGSKSRHCLSCNAKTDVTVIPATGIHSFYVEPVSDATCTESAKEKWICDVCDWSAIVSDPDNRPALGHTFGEWETTKEPTTKTTGEAQRKCTNSGCTEFETKTIAKLEADGHSHSFANALSTKCDVCEHTRELVNISVTTPPTKLFYLQGSEKLNLSGGQITLLYDDETTGVAGITADMVTGFDSTELGEKTLTVTYGGKTTTVIINIIDGIPGDINTDGEVDVVDLALLKKIVAGLEECLDVDLNDDGNTDVVDLAILKKMVAGLA